MFLNISYIKISKNVTIFRNGQKNYFEFFYF
jgi:hypothetical protein